MVIKGEILSYPLLMVTSVGMIAWAIYSSVRGDPSMAPDIYEQFAGAALLVLGFVLSAAIHGLGRRRFASQASEPGSTSDFNSEFIRETIAVVLPPRRGGYTELPPWEVTSTRLVGHDNALALAKLRLDIERLLREAAFSRNIDTTRAGTGAVKLARLLGEQGAIPVEVIEPTRQIVSICNRAIHGDEISDELAESVVASGEDLLTRLRQHIEHEATGVSGTSARDQW